MTCVVMFFVGRPGKQQTLSYAKVNIAICPENISASVIAGIPVIVGAIFCKNKVAGCRSTGFALDVVYSRSCRL
jgi:hypothetical protein